MIEVKNLGHSFGSQLLFEKFSLKFLPHERYGIVGANGSGKSTLLKILTSEQAADQGKISIGSLINIFRIGQDQNLKDNEIILDIAMKGRPQVFAALKNQQEIHDSGDTKKIAEITELLENEDGYALAALAHRILSGLGISQDKHKKQLSILSGGYKWRCYLAQTLVRNPEILLLDEPTNHLDIESIGWLEKFLHNYSGCIILVSHDTYFLNSVCTQILDIDFQNIKLYPGNYSNFTQQKELFLSQKEKEIIAQEKEISHKQAFVDKFRYKASKARQAQSRLKQIEKIEVIKQVKSSRLAPKFNFDFSQKSSREVLQVKNLYKSYQENKILENISFGVQSGQKIAIIGPNGAGKSTLIKALALEFPECNNFIKWGHNTNLGYFPQDCSSNLKLQNKSVLDWLWQFCPDKPQSFVQSMLGKILLTKDDASKLLSNLSGGELSKLFMAKLMLNKPNILLLDEPTNHLDVESISSLASSLKNYPGTLIFVSHDRNFINNIADIIFYININKLTIFLGSYENYISKFEENNLIINQDKKTKINNNYEKQKKKKSNLKKLQKKLENLILELEQEEKQVKQINLLFSQSNFYQENNYEKISQLEEQKRLHDEKINTLLQDWDLTESKIKKLNQD